MEGIDTIAQLMAVAAVTAPKAKGQNFVQVKILKEKEVQALGKAMIAYQGKSKQKNFERDGKNVLDSEAVILIGLKDASTSGLDCSACGFETCEALKAQQPVNGEFHGPTCAIRILDMGIALGSAVKMASILNVDNRVMYRAGAVARDMKLVDWDFVMGIPLSISGKSIYFDR